jgi:hypothetical protein
MHVAGFSGICVEEEESACFANFVSIVAAIRSSFRLGWEIVLAYGIFRLSVFREINAVCPGSPTLL